MSSTKKILLSWSWMRLRPHVASQSASSFTTQVQDACYKPARVGNRRCITNDASHRVKGNRMMVQLTVHSFSDFELIPLNMDMDVSHIQPTIHACNLYARTSVFKSRSFSMRMINHARMLSTETRTIKSQCWSCGRSKSEKGFLLCPSCNAVQAPDPDITYFEIFDLDQKFELNLKDLETKYKSLMKRLHPDLTHGKSTEEKENYAHWSALVTTAYTELLKQVSRATYLLRLRGIHVEEEGTVTDSELIMEVLEIRETLQSKPPKQVLEQLNKKVMARMEEWTHAFKTALDEGNNTSAVGALQRMSYFGRVCQDINRELL